MTSQITYELETKLSVPGGVPLNGIAVTVEIEPASAGCIIYGYSKDGNIQPVHVTGAQTELELPFAQPQIYVKYLLGLKTIKIHTRGWRVDRG
jgi:hypothetical protein